MLHKQLPVENKVHLVKFNQNFNDFNFFNKKKKDLVSQELLKTTHSGHKDHF